MAIDSRNKRSSAGSMLFINHAPLPDGTIGAADRRQVSGFYAGIAATGPIVYASYGGPFLLEKVNYDLDMAYYLEVYMRATSGTAHARLLNVTDNAAISLSELSTVSSTFTRLRSSALALADSKEYAVQLGVQGADTGEAKAGTLLMY
jgi:hypothetical protein